MANLLVLERFASVPKRLNISCYVTSIKRQKDTLYIYLEHNYIISKLFIKQMMGYGIGLYDDGFIIESSLGSSKHAQLISNINTEINKQKYIYVVIDLNP